MRIFPVLSGPPGPARFSFLIVLVAVFAPFARAAETIPPAPRDHFNDYAGIVSSAAAQSLNSELTQFERTTSNQIVVAIYPHMQSDSSIEDYTVRVAQAWGVGQKDKKNGAVLFIFSQDRKLFIQVGYGLEGALPDALCKQIVANEITPRFRTGDFTGGVTAGVHAMLAATRGEYRGTGRAVADQHDSGGLGLAGFIAIIVFVIILGALRSGSNRNTVYSPHGRTSAWPWLIAAALSSRSSGGSSSNWRGGGGGGGGSFSGGGGSFGGGGAGGSW
jgi:uncharacterized protein